MKLQDGTGKSLWAKVNSAFQLLTRAITESISNHEIEQGNGYTVSTGVVALTAGTSGLLYIKNTTDETDLAISGSIVSIGAGTAGNNVTLQGYVNPTTGTLISGANAARVNNRNHGSTKIPSILAYAGVDGDTVTDGDAFGAKLGQPGQSIPVISGANLLLKPGNSFALTVNTAVSLSVAMNLVFYFEPAK